jgi:hypothetical protein
VNPIPSVGNPVPTRPVNPIPPVSNPVAPVQPSPVTPNLVRPTPSKGGGLVIKIIGIVIILGIIGAGAVMAMGIWDPVWSPFRPNPEKVITAMAQNMMDVKSSHSEGKLELDIQEQNASAMAIDVNFSVDGDARDIANIKSAGNFGLDFIGGIMGDASSPVSAEFQMKTIGQEGYFNITTLNAPALTPLLLMTGIDLDNVIGTWIKFPAADSFSTGVPITQDPAEMAAIVESMRKAMSDVTADSKFYVVKEQLPNQTIDGQKIYHYLVALDNEETAQLMGNLMAEVMEQSGLSALTVMPDGTIPDKGAVSAQIKAITLAGLEKIGEISAELSIGSKDNFLYGMKLVKTIDVSKIDPETAGTVDIVFEINNSAFNEPVVVEAPLVYKNFEEVFPSTPPVVVNP